MITLIATYRPIGKTGRKDEAASPKNIQTELSRGGHEELEYQDINGNIYTFSELHKRRIQLKDKTSVRLHTYTP